MRRVEHFDGAPSAPFPADGQRIGRDAVSGYVGRIKGGELIPAVLVGVRRPTAAAGGAYSPSLAEVFGDLEWADHAACRDAVAIADDFHAPSIGGNPPESAHRVALAYCRTCPVIRECAADASERLAVGVWGGAHRTCKGRQPETYRAVPLVSGAPTHKPATADVTDPSVVAFPTTTTDREAIA